jgi:hypothetical protein
LENAARRTSNPMLLVMLVIALVMLALAIHQLYSAYSYTVSGYPEQASYPAFVGLIGVIAASYMLLQLRRRRIWSPTTELSVKSTAECGNCGFKDIRKFREGDYVFKPSDPCPKCNSTTMVTSIYYEEEKKKS